MIKIFYSLLILIFISACTSNEPKETSMQDELTNINIADTVNQNSSIVENKVVKPRPIDTTLEDYISKLGLHERFTVATNHEPYYLIGLFNNDNTLDTVIIVEDKKNLKQGLLIKHGNSSDPIILGAGKKVLAQGFDDFNWIGVFNKVDKGERIASNIDEETGEITEKDIPDSLKTELKNEGIYVHELESCGGGVIYWDKTKYNWIQQE